MENSNSILKRKVELLEIPEICNRKTFSIAFGQSLGKRLDDLLSIRRPFFAALSQHEQITDRQHLKDLRSRRGA